MASIKRAAIILCTFSFLPIVLSQTCSAGWTLIFGRCYRAYEGSKTWYESRTACQDLSGDLVAIKSVDLQNQLTVMLLGNLGSYWIGLQYNNTAGDFYWVDSTQLNPDVPRWNVDEPNNIGNGEDCVEMYGTSGLWNDARCTSTGNYICERGTDFLKKCDEDNGWQSANGKCYKLYDNLKTWEGAKTFCKNVDGDLVDINSADEQTVVTATSQLSRQTFWIGLTNKDSDDEDTYTWSTGEQLSYTTWATNEPANRYYGVEGDCAEVLDTAVNGQWVTARCTDSRQFMCERNEGTCPPGWRIHKGNCYQFNSNTQVSYTDAKHVCEAQGAFLVSIFSGDENNFVISQFKDLDNIGITDIWIGIADYPDDGVFIWSDNSAVTYTNWKTTEPTDTAGQHDCGMIYTGDSSGQWNTNNCYVLKAYVCKVRAGQPVYTISPNLPVGVCPAGWNLFGDSCYYASTTRSNWNSAETYCTNQNSHLVAINDEDEQSYISMRVDSIGIDTWIGLHDSGSRTNFVWTDGSSLDFENWAAGNPDYPSGGEACVAAMVQDNMEGMWDDLSCTADTKPYICEKPKECETYTSRGTDLDYYYRYHPSPLPSNRVEFEVKAASDVHIGLSSSNTGEGQTYEIVIGGWSNTQSAIRRCIQCATEVEVSTPNILSSTEFRGFWITYTTDGLISVGKYGEGVAFMEWTDPNPFQINYIGYTTGFGSTGEFKFCNLDAGSSTGNVLPTAAFDPRCGSGWEYDSMTGNCYLFEPYVYKTWADAEYRCNIGGGYLVSISGVEEMSYINSRLALVTESQLWIGATDVSREGGWMWSDNSGFGYLNWAPGEPNNAGEEHCAEMYVNTGTWNDVYCDKALGYICKKDGYLVDHFNVYHMTYIDGYDTLKVSNIFPEDCAKQCVQHTSFTCRSFEYNMKTMECSLSDASTLFSGLQTTFNEDVDYYERPVGEQCETGWDLFESKCYLLDKYMYKDWPDSRTECQAKDADLVVIKSSQLQNWLTTKVIALEGSYWIGLHDMSGEGDFEWVDGSKLSETGFSRWDLNEPNNIGGEDCVEMYSSGFWNDQTCSEIQEGLICEKDSVYDVPYEDITPTLPPSFQCPSGWQAYGDNCFYLQLSEGSWQDARDQCRTQGSGSELASIASSQENDFVASLVAKSGVTGPLTNFWIGLNDLRVSLTFEWVDGSEIVFTNWGDSEPNNFIGKDEDCVEMDAAGAWNDQRCSVRNPSICKMSRTFMEVTVPPVTSAGCDLGWVGYGGSCYGLPGKVTAEWNRAQIACQGVGAKLASIKDRYEQTVVTSILAQENGNPVWIGLNDQTVTGEYQWSDGTAVTYTNWNYQEPKENSGNCVAATTGDVAGLWQVRSCNTRYDYLCESVRVGYTAPPTVTPPRNPTPPNDNNCAEGWIGYGDRCFGVFDYEGRTRQQRSWQLALSRCRAIGGDLASFHSREEEEYVKGRIGTTDRQFWIGLYDKSVESGFEWSDGTVVNYVNWGEGEPNNRGTIGEDCVEIFHDDGWNDDDCARLSNWLCQIERGKVPSDTPAPPPSLPPYTPCPTAEDWVLEGDYCYYFSAGANLRLGWNEANDWCMQNSGYLVSIHGSDEQEKLVYYARTYSYNSHWIGIREYDISGDYVWADGTPIDYQNWNEGEPNDSNGEEQCGEMYANDGLWNDLNCGDATPFICKRVYHETVPKTNAPTEPPTGNCPSGWDQYGYKCYKIYGYTESEMRSWYDARDNCQAQGGELVIIHSQEIQSFIITKMKEVKFKVFIGLSDITDNDRFRWVDGTVVDYTNWDGREPNESGGEEDCVEMLWKDGVVGRWNDIPCDRATGYMCQRNIDPSYPQQPPDSNDCDTGYVQYYDSCFRLITSEMDFATAGAICQGDGYYLASIFDEYEEAFIETLMYSNGGIPVWIGMSKNTNEEYVWVDGWPAAYTNWGFREPSDGIGEGCVMINEEGDWDDTRCISNHRAVCKYTTLTKPTNPPDTPGTCPEDWIEYGNDCFLVKAAVLDLASFPEAQFICQGYGANLASIHSSLENQLIFDAVSITLTDVWIGMDRTVDGPFTWIDGTSVNYLYWANNEPSYTSGAGLDELCVEMYPGSGKWNDRECLQKQGYVCRASKYVLNPTNGPPVTGPARTTEGSGKPTPQPKTGMSSGAIAGIVISVIVVVCLVAVAVFFLMTRYKSPSIPKDPGLPPSTGFDNALYTSSSKEGKVQIGDTNASSMEA